MLKEIILTEEEVKKILDIQYNSEEWISHLEAVRIFLDLNHTNFVTIATGTASNPKPGLIVKML